MNTKEEDVWSLGQITEAAQQQQKSGGRCCVLLTTGAMNPPHRGHVHMMQVAKEALERKHGLAVLGGFISPSHDLYVGPKCQRLRTAFAAAHHRCDLAELLIRDLDEAVPKEGGMQGEGNGWLHLSRWESDPKHADWPDFPEVIAELSANVGPDILVIYVCGSDLAMKCGLARGISGAGVFVVQRQNDPAIASDPSRCVFGETQQDQALASISSTQIRAALSQKDLGPLALQSQACVDYVLRHRLYGAGT